MNDETLQELGTVSFDEIALRCDRLFSRFSITGEAARFARGMDLKVLRDHGLDQLILELTKYVYFSEGESQLFVPKTWWDHLKLAVREHPRCPRWLFDRIWVCYDCYTPRAYLPELCLSPDRMGKPIYVFATR